MSRYFFLIFFLIFSLFSCQKRKDQLKLPFTVWVEVPAGLNTFFTHHFPVRVPTFGSVPPNILDARPSNIRITLENGASSFDFVRRAYFDAVTDSSRVEMGYNLDIPLNNSSTADLFPSIVDLKDHIQQDSFDAELKLELRGITNATSRLRIDFSLICSINR